MAAVSSTSRTTRTIQVGDRAGTAFDVEVPTHVSAIAKFVEGGGSQSVFGFDSPLTRTGVVEITGSEGTLIIPDPHFLNGGGVLWRLDLGLTPTRRRSASTGCRRSIATTFVDPSGDALYLSANDGHIYVAPVDAGTATRVTPDSSRYASCTA